MEGLDLYLESDDGGRRLGEEEECGGGEKEVGGKVGPYWEFEAVGCCTWFIS